MLMSEEVRDGYMVSAQMKKIWAVEIALVKKLLEVCAKHHFRVWAEGGTLLGTVRHNGFIPWDDDIDMVMFRDEYDKLVQVAAEEFKHPFFFQCGYTEKIYPRGHAQLRMDGTTAVLNNVNKPFDNTHQGIFIDIFPYDAVPDDQTERDKLLAKQARLKNKLERIGFIDWFHPLRSLCLLRYQNKFSSLFKEFETLFRNNKIEDNINISCLTTLIDLDHFLRDKHWYDETIYLPFEDIMMPIPFRYHNILTKHYGDYMTLRREPSYHGDFMILDADKSFTDYDSEIKLRCRLNRRIAFKRRIKNAFKRLTEQILLSRLFQWRDDVAEP